MVDQLARLAMSLLLRSCARLDKLGDWVELVKQLGVPGLHFHDLRHTGNTLAASSGASTRDLMARMGHQSVDAALIYQYATSDADRAVADKLNERRKRDRADEDDDDPDDGAAGVPAVVP